MSQEEIDGVIRMSQTHPHDRLGHPRLSGREREARADMIMDWVAGRLLDDVDDDCARSELQVAMAADLQDIRYSVFNRDGSAQLREIPQEILRAFPDLRDLRFEDNLGTWFSLRIQVDPPENYRSTFNFTVDPMWKPSIPAEKYLEDLQLYPRSAEEIPRWLENKINRNSPAPEVTPGTLPEIVSRTKAASLQLRLALPQGWKYAQFQFHEVGGYREASALVQDISGQMSPWSPPVEVSDRFSELRAASRGRPAIWYKARVELWYTGEEDFQTFGSDEPQWNSAPPAAAFDEELRRAEGFDYELPTWMTALRADRALQDRTELCGDAVAGPAEPVRAAVFEAVGQALMAAVPSGWDRIRFEFRGTVQIDGARLESITEDGVSYRHSVPKVAMREFDRLRRAMYRPRKGTWFTARLMIDRSGGYDVVFDYDSEPDFNPKLTAGAYALDLEYFPRDPVHIPMWLQAKLREVDEESVPRVADAE